MASTPSTRHQLDGTHWLIYAQAGLILENILAGRTKHIWVTTNIDLKEDAQRDLRDVGATIAADLEAVQRVEQFYGVRGHLAARPSSPTDC